MSMWNQRLPRDPGNPAQADSDLSRDREGKSPEFALLSGGESNRDEALSGLPADELYGEASGLSFRFEESGSSPRILLRRKHVGFN